MPRPNASVPSLVPAPSSALAPKPARLSSSALTSGGRLSTSPFALVLLSVAGGAGFVAAPAKDIVAVHVTIANPILRAFRTVFMGYRPFKTFDTDESQSQSRATKAE